MRTRIASAAVYATTAFAFFGFFDGLYAGEPPRGDLTLIHIATAGAILFAVAFLASLVALNLGVGCGFAACVLSWPYWGGVILIRLPWKNFPWKNIMDLLLPYSQWTDILASLLMLIISTAYTLVQLWLFRAWTNRSVRLGESTGNSLH
jgi:hypothetical protein